MKMRSCLKPLIATSCLFACALPPAHGGSATWNLNPGTGTWNTASNWTPATVPNGPSDVATFDASNLTDLTIKSAVEVSAIDFTAGASAFTISVLPRVTLTISGAGVSNSSSVGQNFVTSDSSTGAGTIVFVGSATAGDGNTYTNNAHSNGLSGVAATEFFGTSNAGTSMIINTNPGMSFHVAGFTGFFEQSSGGTISGAATIGTGSGTGAFLVPAAATGEQATIHLAGALTFKSDGTYGWTINSRRQEVRFDEVVAHGVTIETGAKFTVGSDVRGSLALGTVLTVISNTAATPIAGTFANLRDGITLAIGSNHLEVNYEGGNGNDLTFTAIP